MSSALREGRRPNVVVILADDLGYGDVSCQNEDRRVPTPHFDRLAAQGMRFVDAHSSSAVCSAPRRVEPAPGEPPGRLYDMQEDPQETTNLWAERADVVADLTASLDRCRRA